MFETGEANVGWDSLVLDQHDARYILPGLGECREGVLEIGDVQDLDAVVEVEQQADIGVQENLRPGIAVSYYRVFRHGVIRVPP